MATFVKTVENCSIVNDNITASKILDGYEAQNIKIPTSSQQHKNENTHTINYNKSKLLCDILKVCGELSWVWMRN